MTSSIISPLFSVLFCFCTLAIIASADYPNQKYVLFKKLPDGRIRKVETFTAPITREEAISRYGRDRYMLQSMKPRTKTIWKDLSASSNDEKDKNQIQLVQLRPLEQRTKYLAAGLVGLGVGTAIGFGATAVSFLNSNQLLNRATIAIDALLSTYPIPGFLCGTCAAPLVSVFDKFCGQCGFPITSPDRGLPSEQRCPHCSFPVRPNQRHCRECGKPLQNGASQKAWSLP